MEKLRSTGEIIPPSGKVAVTPRLTLRKILQLLLQQAEKYGGDYIGSFSEPPPASQETVSASIERLIVASTPWQELMMHVRRIYRWENQKETSMYLVAFTILWSYGALSAAGVSLSTSGLPRTASAN